jgi:hypothetical protein
MQYLPITSVNQSVEIKHNFHRDKTRIKVESFGRGVIHKSDPSVAKNVSSG